MPYVTQTFTTTTTKWVATPGWNAGARTIAELSADGGFSFSVGQSTGIVCGLNTNDLTADYHEIQHGFFIEPNRCKVVESGVLKTAWTSFSPGAVFKIERILEVVTYYLDGVLIYTSLTPSTGTVFLDSSLYSYLDSIIDATAYTGVTFSASIDIELSAPIAIGTDSTGNILAGLLSPLSVEAEETDVNSIDIELSELIAIGTDTHLNQAVVALSPLSAKGEDSILLPEYNAIVIELRALQTYGLQYDPDPGSIDGELSPLIALGVDDELQLLYGPLSSLTVETYLAVTNYFLTQAPFWTAQIIPKPPVVGPHTTTYGTTALRVHTTSYESDIGRVFQIHESSYQLTAQYAHTTLWNSESTLSAVSIHDATYQSSGGLATVFAFHETDWLSSGSTNTVFATHDTTYYSFALSVNVASASHTAIWSSTPILFQTHTTTYQSVVESFSAHTTKWKSFVQENVGIHVARYRSYTLDPQFILANAYIEPNIQILSASVTADEDSPYYQCEVELRDAKDYQYFVRDQAFILNLFADEYHFVVDSKGLSRTIDDEGNYQESATISGLSPLCLKAAPRSTPITKVWVTPTMASDLVEELIGPVTWHLVDWMIPGYRLSAENADPFEIAQNIVTAAGGLLESQPNGSVVVRHRWPISIALLGTGVPSTILSETVIYSAQEQPTQDVLMNRIRITDSNAGYQDRLEYEPNLLYGEDDPWSGMLYAYLSPWRDGLRIVTTRGSKIQIGNQTESTKQIKDQDDEHAAEILTFEGGQSSTQYPIMTLDSLEWWDENLGGLTFTPYATTVEASASGTYSGYSLARIEYTTRRLQVPVRCTPSNEAIEAQFLLLETQNG